MLSQAGLGDVPAEKRQNIDLLETYLQDLKISSEKVQGIVAGAKEAGLKCVSADEHVDIIDHGSTAVPAATEISDVRRFKSGLMVSQGARPVRDLCDFEDVDAKL
jgi:hypothetical protein